MNEPIDSNARESGAGPAVGLLPVFLKLTGRKVVLVGGGTVATTKHAGLVAAGADVTVVAPHIAEPLRVPGTTLIERDFEATDLEGAWYVVAAAPAAVNRQVLAAANERHLFVNAVDDPPSATAYAGAVVRRGPITLAVSTGGTAPALAGLVREGLEAVLPADLETWAEAARAVRAEWRREGLPMSARRPRLLEALNRLYDGRIAQRMTEGAARPPTPPAEENEPPAEGAPRPKGALA